MQAATMAFITINWRRREQNNASSKAGGFAISEILLGEETVPSYSETKKLQQAEFSGKTYTVQGEEIFQKNDSSITAGLTAVTVAWSPMILFIKR